ncbi:choline kinase alpha-like [Liolophura sinensis]|uniref:choline kinase alpha-like n=1 Tax=Liolophura sinensis TaxID=3198878 RepID=UPI0031582EE7
MANQVPKLIREMVFDWCTSCVGGAWANLPEEDFQISPLSGGLTNMMYICTLPSHCKLQGSEPRRLLVRVYGELSKSMAFVLNSSVLFSILAERKLGPKLFGVFPRGRVEEFLPARPLLTKELAKPEISRQIARKLAMFHSLSVPLCKQPSWFFANLERWVDQAVDNMRYDNKLALNDRLHKYLSFDLLMEFRELKQRLLNENSPVLFCHNDLQEGNILLEKKEDDEEPVLTFIDLDYCNYNYRGFDFANHMMEWCYDYTVDQPPYFKYTPCSYPSLEEKYVFFCEYIQTRDGSSEVKTEELAQMNQETDMFALASSFWWGTWALVQACSSDINFDYVEYSISRFDHYFSWKSKLDKCVFKTFNH